MLSAKRHFKTCSLTEYELRCMDGIIASDGSIVSSKFTSRFSCGCKYKEFLELLVQQFPSLEFGPIIQNKKNLCHFLYSFSYVNLNDIRARWYPDGKKQVPKDFCFTPESMLLWYLGDGCNRPTGGILFSTYGFSREDNEYISQCFTDLGFKSTLWKSNVVAISAKSKSDIFDYMQSSSISIPECYRYKFARRQ